MERVVLCVLLCASLFAGWWLLFVVCSLWVVCCLLLNASVLFDVCGLLCGVCWLCVIRCLLFVVGALLVAR